MLLIVVPNNLEWKGAPIKALLINYTPIANQRKADGKNFQASRAQIK